MQNIARLNSLPDGASFSRIRDMLLGLCGLGTLWVMAAGHANAQSIDLIYENKVQEAQAIKALSGNLFGEYVNDYSGATSFTHVDVSLPGNNALPVQVGRTFSVEEKYGLNSLGGFGDWDVDVPYLMGTFTAVSGWAVAVHTSPDRYKRCSIPTIPYIENYNFNAHEIWNGYQLHVPGGENGELIKANYSDSYPEPTDGLTYPWITQSQSRLRCLGQTKNGYPGEAFVLVTSAGLTYYFDWGVEVAIRGIGKESSRTIARKRVYLLASRVEDRAGNWVAYNYSGAKLMSITASDGRQITLAYSGNAVSSVSSPAGSWSYQYDGAGNLSKVTQPDGSNWLFAFTGSLKLAPPEPLPPLDSWGPPTCEEQLPGESIYEYRVTHPSGATAKFNFEQRRFYRSHVRWMCTRTIPPEALYEWLIVPNYFDSYAISARTVTGPGLAAQVSSYDHGVTEPMGFCDPSVSGSCVFYCPPLAWCVPAEGRWVVNTRPDGTKIKRYMGVKYGIDEGRVLEEQVLNANGAIVSRTINQYVNDQDVTAMPFAGVIGQRLTMDPMSSLVRPLVSSAIVQDGRRFSSIVEQFDALARPVRITKSSAPEP
ncbi:RHS repeat protein [Pseudomonas sp. R2.Fl]|nr:RHS repeat protein [Pseudomonas sp. R2.Fl]